ncbi:MAG: glycoside hydrolase family 16 protein [Solirubrobacteraceae bacterium]
MRALLAGVVLSLLVSGVALAGTPPGKTVTDSFGTVWYRVGWDGFTKPAPVGSWASTNTNNVVYTGDHGLMWHEYPDGWPCSNRAVAYPHCYDPQHVLSVHNGMLDFYLHDCTYPDGYRGACGANPGPFSPVTGTFYQLYGRWSARVKFVFLDGHHLDQYHVAWLLWPDGAVTNGQNCGESDFPELWLNLNPYQSPADAYWHHCPDPLWAQHFYLNTNLTRWHTYTQEWGPGFRRYYVDERLVGQSKLGPTTVPSRWQLQVEAHALHSDHSRGHLLVDWVWIGL